MEPIQSQFADLLMRKRVMTLQSVDDAVEKVNSIVFQYLCKFFEHVKKRLLPL